MSQEHNFLLIIISSKNIRTKIKNSMVVKLLNERTQKY